MTRLSLSVPIMIALTDAMCQIPNHLQGDFYHKDGNEDVYSVITDRSLGSYRNGYALCDNIVLHNESPDMLNSTDATILFYNRSGLHLCASKFVYT